MEDYDEFGNYIGEEALPEEEEEEEEDIAFDTTATTTQQQQSIVLLEDRALFPSATAVFGEDVEIIQASAEEARSVPILPRQEVVHEKKLPRQPDTLTSEEKFQDLLTSNPDLVRSVAFIGALQSGKTNLANLLHRQDKKMESPVADERARRITLKTRPCSSVCQTKRGKSYFVQTLDAPGHANFLDQTYCALECADAAVLVVDVVEGVQLGTELHLHALEQFALGRHLVLCINKMDRLVHELKLPVEDASRKIHLIVSQVEKLIKRKLDYSTQLCFASAEHGWCVDLNSMAKASSPSNARAEDVAQLACRLFGDVYFDGRSFSSATGGGGGRGNKRRAFDVFVLDPLYKIYSHVLGSDAKQVSEALGISLNKREMEMDALPLLKTCLAKSLPHTPSQVLTELIMELPRPDWRKCKMYPVQSATGGEAKPVLVHLIKCIHPLDDLRDEYLDAREENSFAYSKDVTFRVLARVYEGELRLGEDLFVFDADTAAAGDAGQPCRLTNIRIPLRTKMRQVTRATEGMLVLLSGVDQYMTKSGTLVATPNEQQPRFAQLSLFKHSAARALVKIALEPLVPSELPKMLAGLRAIQRAYPSSRVVVEETGEHVLFGTGELYMDCMMKDLRRFAGVEIKVCDPFVALCEGVSEQSAVRSIAETANKKSTFSLIACPLEPNLVRDLDAQLLDVSMDAKALAKRLKNEYGYDILASRSVWAFADEANAFVDDTLGESITSALDGAFSRDERESICQGFRWAVREGPLCEEHVRACKFKLLDCTIGVGGAGQIAPTIRKLCHQSLLRASPVLYEPIYRFDAVSTHHGAIGLVNKLLQQRRGVVAAAADGGANTVAVQHQVPGAKLFRISASLPVLDSFGLETELRLKTKGQVFCQMYFERWARVPGNVLDESLILRALQPSPVEFLARDLLVKTRRRKGLPESLEATSQIDTQLLQEMLRGGAATG